MGLNAINNTANMYIYDKELAIYEENVTSLSSAEYVSKQKKSQALSNPKTLYFPWLNCWW